MKHNEKNRDQEVARKRAKSDARCALRKLGLLDRLEEWHIGEAEVFGPGGSLELLVDLTEALGVSS